MIDGGGGDGDGTGAPRRTRPRDVLADRIAATLVHHEPGWRLPRLTALARRYQVSVAEIESAIGELATRSLVRRLPDGHVYRASPAEYVLPLEGLAGLTSYVDPMGGTIACKRRQVARCRPAESVSRSLELAPGEPVLSVRCLWTVDGKPGALSATYLPERLAAAYRASVAPLFAPGTGAAAMDDSVPFPSWEPPSAPSRVPPRGTAGPPAWALPEGTAGTGRPRALQLEMAPPPPSAARSLGLSAGDVVATVTISFEEPASGSPAVLTVAMLRPELFRIVMQATAGPVPAGSGDALASTWTHTESGWES